MTIKLLVMMADNFTKLVYVQNNIEHKEMTFENEKHPCTSMAK